MNSHRDTGSGLRAMMIVLAGLALLGSCGQASNPAQDEPPVQIEKARYDIKLAPQVDESGEVDSIKVTSTLFGGLQSDETALRLSAPVVYVMVDGIADRIKDLEVTDRIGPVEFTTEDDEPVPGGFPYFRHWTAVRDVTFPVEINYRALVQPPNSPGGPAFGIRPSAGGVSGAGSGYMIVPVNATSEESHLSWDLSAFDKPSVGVTTFGEGDTVVVGPPSALMQGWLMAGPAERYPSADVHSPFNAYWLGDFPYDERGEMVFVSEMYDFLGSFFTHLNPPPEYRVFMRQLDTPPYGGATALGNSFMLSRDPAREDEYGKPGPHTTFVHEMLHQWVGGMNASHGNSTWFTEGLTTYYEYTLPFRAGEIDIEDYLDGLNQLSTIYFTNPGRVMSADAIVKVGFNDEKIRHVPYQRGALYFADLDSRIRAASDGTRNLDTLMTRVFSMREDGSLDLTLENWAAEAAKETGADEYALLIATNIDGSLIVPADDAFGHCVRGLAADFDADGETAKGVRWEAVSDTLPENCFSVK